MGPHRYYHSSNSNEGTLHIPQNSWIEASPSDGLMSYPGYLLEVSAEMKSVYSTTPADWAVHRQILLFTCEFFTGGLLLESE